MAEHSEYIESIQTYRDALSAALKIVEDPFKAPELNIEESKNVIAAIWNMNLEFQIMMREGERARRKGERKPL